MESTELPPSLQPKVERIKKRMDAIKKTREEIDATMEKIKKKIKEAKPRRYKLTENEKSRIKKLMRRLKNGLQTAEEHQTKAEETLQSLLSDNNNHVNKEAASSVRITLETSKAAGELIVAAGCLLNMYLGEDFSIAALKGPTATGACVGEAIGQMLAMGQIRAINGRYEERQKEIEYLKNDLEDLALEVRKKKRDVDDLDELVNELCRG